MSIYGCRGQVFTFTSRSIQVRARMPRSARDWPWSSYRATAGQVDPPGFLTTAWLLSQFNDDPAVAIHSYRAFVNQGRDIDAWGDLKAGMFLGTDAFVESLKPMLRDVSENREIRREERLATRLSLKELFAEVEDKPTRNRQIHTAVRKYEYKLKEVGDFLGLSYPTISVIVKRVGGREKS